MLSFLSSDQNDYVRYTRPITHQGLELSPLGWNDFLESLFDSLYMLVKQQPDEHGGRAYLG